MRNIRHTQTLFYYDSPQVFEARDDAGAKYIGVMIQPEGDEDHFLISSPHSPDRVSG